MIYPQPQLDSLRVTSVYAKTGFTDENLKLYLQNPPPGKVMHNHVGTLGNCLLALICTLLIVSSDPLLKEILLTSSGNFVVYLRCIVYAI